MSAPADTVKGIGEWTQELVDQLTDEDSDLYQRMAPLFQSAEQVTLENSGKTQEELIEYLFMGDPIDQSYRMVTDLGIAALGDLVEDSGDNVMTEAGRTQVEKSARLGPAVYEVFTSHVLPLWNWYLQIIFDHGPQLADYISNDEREAFHEYSAQFKPELPADFQDILDAIEDPDSDFSQLLAEALEDLEDDE